MSELLSSDQRVVSLAQSVALERERFLDTVGALRPRLHQFCTRMTGSVFDGEDVVQDALAHAFFKLPTLKDAERLEAWLFRIAHNKAIDLLRQRRDTATFDDEEVVMGTTPEEQAENEADVTRALSQALTRLPPKERACLVLKDVLGYTLSETAGIADSTIAGVKAALHRARSKLADVEHSATTATLSGDELALLEAYVERFNRQDWPAVRELLQADARLELVGTVEARGAEFIASNYFLNYAALPWNWRFTVAEIDGRLAALMFKQSDDGWQAHALFQLTWSDGCVSGIRDYIHVPYILADANVREIGSSAELAKSRSESNGADSVGQKAPVNSQTAQ